MTVISGTFAVGMGDKLDKAQSKMLKPGGYAVVPADMHHFQITNLNPADDPSKKK